MFTFRLQPVLRYRLWVEEEKQLTFAQRSREYENEVRRGQELKEVRNKYFQALREETSRDEVTVNVIAFYQTYIHHLDNQIEIQVERIREALRKMEAARQEHLEARRQREIMDKAREKALEQYNEEQDHQHRLFLDELATIRYTRGKEGLDPFGNRAVING